MTMAEHGDMLAADRTMSTPQPLSKQKQSSYDGGSDGYLSELSTASCSSISRGRAHSNGTSNTEVRRRYLHRLGIHDDSSNQCSAHADSCSCNMPQEHQKMAAPSGGDVNVMMSYSAPEKNMGRMQQPPSKSLRQSLSNGAMSAPPLPSQQNRTNSHRDNIILLRRSVIYATPLKSDPKDTNTGTGNSSQPRPTSKKVDEDDKKDATAPKSSSSKFELSSAWTTLLSKDTSSTASASSEPLDGAYDLFSLPSDSSLGASVNTTTTSVENAALERLPSRDSLSAASSTMPRRRKVSFDSTVKAATIPSRLSYSNRMRSRLWSGTEDIYANAIRNEKEYQFDGSNWRTAREESDFLRCSSMSSSSQEEILVHPVHLCGWASSPPPQTDAVPVSNNSGSSSKNGQGNNVVEKEEQDDDYSGGMFEMD